MFFWFRPEIVHETIHISARFSKEDTHQYLRIFIIIIKIIFFGQFRTVKRAESLGLRVEGTA